MALFHANFFSEALGMCVNADIIIPENTKRLIGMDSRREENLNTLYLLHGLSDDHTIWQRRTSIERYASRYSLAVVMPCAHRSWYTDMAHGGAYYTYIAEELPRYVQSVFKGVSADRERNYIAGLSMGGYGALKIALRNPSSFRAAAAFSSAIDIYERVSGDTTGYYTDIFGSASDVKEKGNDVFELAKAVAALTERPDIYMWCGTEDRLIDVNRRFDSHLTALGYPHTYTESSGIHAWEYWDREIEKVISLWFGKK